MNNLFFVLFILWNTDLSERTWIYIFIQQVAVFPRFYSLTIWLKNKKKTEKFDSNAAYHPLTAGKGGFLLWTGSLSVLSDLRTAAAPPKGKKRRLQAAERSVEETLLCHLGCAFTPFLSEVLPKWLFSCINVFTERQTLSVSTKTYPIFARNYQ